MNSAHNPIDNTEKNHPIRRLYGRRIGKPARGDRAQAMDALYPVLSIDRNMLDEKANINPQAFFASPIRKLHFEIGFGNGEHITHVLQQHPDDHIIGAEPFANGMSAFLKSIQDQPEDHHRVRVLMDDALLALNSLQDQSVDVLYILNPDPWPKKRHHRRRVVNPDNLNSFSRVLKDDGVMIQTTDVDDLAGWMVAQTTAHPDFEWTAESAQDWKTPPAGWISTRYENKGRAAGRTQVYLIYRRKKR